MKEKEMVVKQKNLAPFQRAYEIPNKEDLAAAGTFQGFPVKSDNLGPFLVVNTPKGAVVAKPGQVLVKVSGAEVKGASAEYTVYDKHIFEEQFDVLDVDEGKAEKTADPDAGGSTETGEMKKPADPDAGGSTETGEMKKPADFDKLREDTDEVPDGNAGSPDVPKG